MEVVCPLTIALAYVICGIHAQTSPTSASTTRSTTSTSTTTQPPLPDHGVLLTADTRPEISLLPVLPENVNSVTGFVPGISFADPNVEPTACALDYRRDELFIHDLGTKQIYMGQNLASRLSSGENNFTTIQYGVGYYESRIAVDWVSHNIYWTDNGFNHVAMAPARPHLEPDLYKVILRDKVKIPSGLTIDPNSGYIFLTNIETKTIVRSSLTGQNPIHIVSSRLTWPFDISADVVDKRLYWVDIDLVWTSDYDGNSRKLLFRDAQEVFASIEVFKEAIMVTGYYSGDLLVYDKTNGTAVAESSSFWEVYLDVCMFHKDAQPRQNDGSTCVAKGCQDICVVEPPSFTATCLCREGYELAANQLNCTESPGSHHRAIIFSDGSKVCQLDIRALSDFHQTFLDSMNCFYTHADSSDPIRFLDVRTDTRTVFLATKSKIHQISMDIDNPTPVPVVSTAGTIGGIGYDWTSKNLFYTETEGGTINVVSMTTMYTTTLAENYTSVGDILLIPHSGSVYWTSGHNSTHSTIYKADMDLKNASVITTVVGTPTNFVDDKEYDSILFMVDGDVLWIEYDGGQPQKQANLSGGITAFTVYMDYFVAMGRDGDVTNFTAGLTLHSDDLSEGTLKDVGIVVDIKIQDSALQPPNKDPCSEMNGGCEHICLPSGSGRECLCDLGFTLGTDRMSCDSELETDNFILVVDLTHDAIYQVPLDEGKSVKGVKHGASGYLRSVLYNHLTGTIVYSSDELWESSFNGSVHRVLLEASPTDSLPNRMALDSSTGNIYYTSGTYSEGHIGVLLPSGHHTPLVVSSDLTMLPRDIALDPERGYMFWIDVGYDAPGLHRAYMDGSNAIQLLTEPEVWWLVGLALDTQNQRIYLTDGFRDIIYTCTYSGAGLVEIHSEPNSALEDIVLDGDFLYFTAWDLHYIVRLNTKNITDRVRLQPDFGLGVLNGMDLYRSSTTTRAVTECSSNNGGCSHFCFPTPDGHTCGCEDGVQLLSDMKTCSNAIRCPTQIPNAIFPESCLSLIGETCSVTCADGHALKPGMSGDLTCVDATWSEPDPCQETLCTDVIPHGNLSIRCHLTVGSECRVFTCGDGYERRPDVTSVTCQPSGKWSVDPGTLCQAKCPSRIRNGALYPSCLRELASSCSFQCVQNFKPRDNNTQLVCRETGQWDRDPNTVCEEIRCSRTVGLAQIQEPCPRTIGARCRYTCPPGSLLNGQGLDLVCGTDGNWTPSGAPGGGLCIVGAAPLPAAQTQADNSLNAAIGIFVAVIVVLIIVIIALTLYVFRIRRNNALNRSPTMAYHTGKESGDGISGIENPQYSEIHGPAIVDSGTEADNVFGYTTLHEEKLEVPVAK